jgi:cob(I)alamin adenosyltransferase
MKDSFSFLGGKRLKKSAPIFEALGDLDELNAALGLVKAFAFPQTLKQQILALQNDLIEIGGFLSGVSKGDFLKKKTTELKKKIEKIKDSSVKKFSSPGANKTSAFLHLARAFCRRLERKVVGLGKKKYHSLAVYLNLLSSFLFWLAKKEEKIL